MIVRRGDRDRRQRADGVAFREGRQHDINIRGAYLHMASDALVSVAVVFSGFVIVWTGQRWVDPVMSLAVAVVILWGSVGLLKESMWMSLAGVPSGIDLDAVESAARRLAGVNDVHDVHIWPLSTTETALTAHMVQPAGSADELIARGAAHAPRPVPYRTFHAAGRTRPPRKHGNCERRSQNVTHLECSLTGERYEAGQVHNLQPRGQAAAGPLRSRGRGADDDAGVSHARETGMWKWRELLPTTASR